MNTKQQRMLNKYRFFIDFICSFVIISLQIYLLLLNYTLRLFISDKGLCLFNAPLPPVIPLYLGLADAVYVATAVDIGVDGLGGITFDVTTAVNRGVDV